MAGESFPGAGFRPAGEYAPGQLVIKFTAAGLAESSVAAFEAVQAAETLQAVGGTRLRSIETDPRYQLSQVPQGKEAELASLMNQQPGVDYAE